MWSFQGTRAGVRCVAVYFLRMAACGFDVSALICRLSGANSKCGAPCAAHSERKATPLSCVAGKEILSVRDETDRRRVCSRRPLRRCSECAHLHRRCKFRRLISNRTRLHDRIPFSSMTGHCWEQPHARPHCALCIFIDKRACSLLLGGGGHLSQAGASYLTEPELTCLRPVSFEECGG